MLYENWKKYIENGTAFSISEYPIYSDITVTSELLDGLEPMSFHNALPLNKRAGEVVIPIVVRVGICLEIKNNDWSISNYGHYHGGWLNDEIAALMSFALGARFHAGNSIRDFGGFEKDPLGSPRFDNLSQPPLFFVRERGHILPEVAKSKCLDELLLLNVFLKLSHDTASKFVQCARQYQSALWVSESNPDMCWLLLVSAIEIAANEWASSESNDTENLKLTYPEYYSFIEQFNSDELVENTATTFCAVTKASSKFLKFCMNYSPTDLEQENSAGFEFSKKKLKKAFNKIYGYRSLALHSGVPFPAPMCRAPEIIDSKFWQRPTGLGSSTNGATWLKDDLPMNLHLFHYLTRSILTNWLKSYA